MGPQSITGHHAPFTIHLGNIGAANPAGSFFLGGGRKLNAKPEGNPQGIPREHAKLHTDANPSSG